MIRTPLPFPRALALIPAVLLALFFVAQPALAVAVPATESAQQGDKCQSQATVTAQCRCCGNAGCR